MSHTWRVDPQAWRDLLAPRATEMIVGATNAEPGLFPHGFGIGRREEPRNQYLGLVRIEELRWRVRYRTEHESPKLDPINANLVSQLDSEVAGLLERVADEIENPSVQPLGLVQILKVGTAVDSSTEP
jgi:hypothetical protein